MSQCPVGVVVDDDDDDFSSSDHAVEGPVVGVVVPAPREDRLGSQDGNRKNFLIDASILDTYPLQALVPTILATLVRFTSDENEVRFSDLRLFNRNLHIGALNIICYPI